MWTVYLRKATSSRVMITIRNPQGGSESGSSGSSFKSALDLLKYRTSLGSAMQGAGEVLIIHQVWDPERGDYRTTKEYMEIF